MKILPFEWTPASWGLKGKSRLIAKAEYELSGIDLDMKLAEINSESENDLKIAKLKINKKYDKISQQDYEKNYIELTVSKENLEEELLIHNRKYKNITKEEYDFGMASLKYKDSPEYNHVLLELNKKYNKISDNEYQKSLANLNNEPWVGVVHSEYKPGLSHEGFSFELDWNDEFVAMLRKNGYNGIKDEDVVEQWFEDTAGSEFNRIFDEPTDTTVPKSNTIHEKLDDNKTKHS